VGEGKIYYSERKTPGGKLTHTHTYYVGGYRGIRVLKSLLPYLVLRADKARMAIKARSNIKAHLRV